VAKIPNLKDFSTFFGTNRLSKELFPNNFHQNPFSPLSIKLPVENLFPGTKVQLAAGYGNNHFTPHYSPFQVGIRVYFGCIVAVRRNRLVRRQLFKPNIKIVVKTGFVIVDKNTCGYMHCVHEAQPFLYA
jgi:hypothetical protein